MDLPMKNKEKSISINFIDGLTEVKKSIGNKKKYYDGRIIRW